MTLDRELVVSVVPRRHWAVEVKNGRREVENGRELVEQLSGMGLLGFFFFLFFLVAAKENVRRAEGSFYYWLKEMMERMEGKRDSKS